MWDIDIKILTVSQLKNTACSHLEDERLVSEPEVLRGHEAVEEDVDALAHAERGGHDAVGAGHAVQAADEVRQVVEHLQKPVDSLTG